MKVLILHGDYQVKSYERLSSILKSTKKRGFEINRISAEDSLAEKISSKSLFSIPSLFVLEKIKQAKKGDLKWLKKNIASFDVNIVVYEPSKLSKTIINSFPKAKVEEFKLPKYIWKFLDEFYPGNLKSVLRLLHELVKTEAPELIVGLLNWRLSDIYIFLKEPAKISYDTWRLKRLENQANKYSEAKVVKILRMLGKADFEAKIGKTEILTSLDLIIASELE